MSKQYIDEVGQEFKGRYPWYVRMWFFLPYARRLMARRIVAKFQIKPYGMIPKFDSLNPEVQLESRKAKKIFDAHIKKIVLDFIERENPEGRHE